MKNYFLCLFVFFCHLVNAQSEKEIYRKLGDAFCDSLGTISNQQMLQTDSSTFFLFEKISTFFDVRKNENLHLGIKELHKFYPRENYDTLKNILIRYLVRDFILNCNNYKKIINYNEITDTTEQQFWLSVGECMHKEGYTIGKPYMTFLENCKFNVYWGVGYERDFYGLIYSNNDIAGQWLKLNCLDFIEEQCNFTLNFLSDLTMFHPLSDEMSVLNSLLRKLSFKASSLDTLSVYGFEKNAFAGVSNNYDNIKSLLQNTSNYSIYQFEKDSIFYIVNINLNTILFGIDFKYDLFERKITKFIFLEREDMKKIKKLEEELIQSPPPPPPVKEIKFIPPIINSDELPPPPPIKEPIIIKEPPK